MSSKSVINVSSFMSAKINSCEIMMNFKRLLKFYVACESNLRTDSLSVTDTRVQFFSAMRELEWKKKGGSLHDCYYHEFAINHLQYI